VNVLDFGEHDGQSFLVMEHVAGGSLKEAIEDGPMEPGRACDLIRQAALAAGAAHAEEIFHRDIKPGNILIDEQGHVKLADFGIASTAVAERLTATGAAIGSPHYVSPEQAQGETANAQSDVYALGVVLYELLTGVRPIDADNIAAIAIAHVEEEPVPPNAHVPDLDPELVALVMRCLRKQPGERFDDGNDLAAALERFARHSTVTVGATALIAHDEDIVEGAPDQPNRAGWMLASAAVVAVLVVIGVALALNRPTEEAGARQPVPSASKTESDKPRKRKPSPTVTTTTTTEAGVPSPDASEPAEPEDEDGASEEDDDEDEGRSRKTRKPPPRPRPSKPAGQPSPPATPAASPSG
jgi:serine/threonine-protein kinase